LALKITAADVSCNILATGEHFEVQNCYWENNDNEDTPVENLELYVQ